MIVGVIGSGHMGSAFAYCLSVNGHSVVLTSKNMEKARTIAKELGPKVEAVAGADFPSDVDMVIAATPYHQQIKALQSTAHISGKVILEISNPIKPDMSGLLLGGETSGAEEISKALPDLIIVKAFNTVFAQVLRDGPDFGDGLRVPVFYAGDDTGAKKLVKELVESIEFDPIDAGPLTNARYLESLGALNIWFGYMAKVGTDIAPTWIKRVGNDMPLM